MKDIKTPKEEITTEILSIDEQYPIVHDFLVEITKDNLSWSKLKRLTQKLNKENYYFILEDPNCVIGCIFVKKHKSNKIYGFRGLETYHAKVLQCFYQHNMQIPSPYIRMLIKYTIYYLRSLVYSLTTLENLKEICFSAEIMLHNVLYNKIPDIYYIFVNSHEDVVQWGIQNIMPNDNFKRILHYCKKEFMKFIKEHQSSEYLQRLILNALEKENKE